MSDAAVGKGFSGAALLVSDELCYRAAPRAFTAAGLCLRHQVPVSSGKVAPGVLTDGSCPLEMQSRRELVEGQEMLIATISIFQENLRETEEEQAASRQTVLGIFLQDSMESQLRQAHCLWIRTAAGFIPFSS